MAVVIVFLVLNLARETSSFVGMLHVWPGHPSTIPVSRIASHPEPLELPATSIALPLRLKSGHLETKFSKRADLFLTETADHFVSEQGNLDPGESLLRAIKAFDNERRFLCSGVLVLSSGVTEDCVFDSDPKEPAESHDVWLCDSLQTGVESNLQVQGALAVLDCLFLHHLKTSACAPLRVFADGEFASASRSAAQDRGFTFQLQPGTGDEALVFDSRHRGLEAYTRAVLSDPGISSLPCSILSELSRRRVQLAMPSVTEADSQDSRPGLPWVPGLEHLGRRRAGGMRVQVENMTRGNLTCTVLTGLLGACEGGSEAPSCVDAEWAVRNRPAGPDDEDDGGGLPGVEGAWSMDKATEVARGRLRKFRVVRSVVRAEQVSSVLMAISEWPHDRAVMMMMEGGHTLPWVASHTGLATFLSSVQQRVAPLVRDMYADETLELTDVEVATPSSTCVTEAVDDNARWCVSALVALGAHSAESGGAFLQCGAHAASRRFVPLDGGDVLVCGFDTTIGTEFADRRHHAVWLRFRAMDDVEAGESSVRLAARAADAGDDVGQLAVARELEREAALHDGNDADPDSETQIGDDALRWYLRSAAQGNPRALARLGTALGAGSRLDASVTDLPPEFERMLQSATPASLWEVAARQGDAWGQALLAAAYRDSTAGCAPDPALAKSLFLLAAQQGHAGGCFALAQLLLFDAESGGVSVTTRPPRRPGDATTASESDTKEAVGRRRERVRVSGLALKDGMPDTWCCGEYVQGAQTVNGRAVFSKVGDARFALWYDSIGMWRIGDSADVGSEVGRASVRSESPSPAGPHLQPWTAFVWAGRKLGGEWVEQAAARAVDVGGEGAPSACATDWEPIELGPEDLYEEGCFWLREGARRGHEGARTLMERLKLTPVA